VLAFVLRRLLWTIPVLFVVVTAIFFLTRSIGGSPLRHGPLVGLTSAGGWQKYGANYLAGVARFDYGPSLTFRDRSVNEILEEQTPNSLELAALALAWRSGSGSRSACWPPSGTGRRSTPRSASFPGPGLRCRPSSSRRSSCTS
jgi:ABC-type microcin C transport system permease subunit YejB